MGIAWFKEFVKTLGGLPESYVVVDSETTGVDVKKDLIVQTGLAIVKYRKLRTVEPITIDWTRSHFIDQDWLKDRLSSQQADMTANGKGTHKFTYEYLQTNGIPPIEALRGIHYAFRFAIQNKLPILMHNGWRFDVPIYERHFVDYLCDPLRFDDNAILDGGILELAIQMELMPFPDESSRDFSSRLSGILFPGLRWNLDRHCNEKYGLADKLRALGIEPKFHDAGVDCVASHLMIEALRSIAESEE